MTTKFNADALKETAVDLGRIMDDMSAFTALRATWPRIGNFDLAQYLEAVIDDRRNGVVAHAEQLKISLEKTETALMKIAMEFEAVDEDNAKQIMASISDLRTRVREDIIELGGE
jgi:hypothetical protein